MRHVFNMDTAVHTPLSGEENALRHFWQSILCQAFKDATCPEFKGETGIHKMDRFISRHWLTENKTDFAFVCECAGYDHDHVRNKALKLKAQNWPPQNVRHNHMGRHTALRA